MIYIGIDPGGKGAIACYDDLDQDIKIYPFKMIGNEIDHKGIASFLSSLSENRDCKAVLEDVHAIYGCSAKGTFNFGHIKGFLEGSLTTLDIPYTLVQPKKWQKEMWEGIRAGSNNKANSIAAAKRLYPQISLKRTSKCTKDDDNIADALLLMGYCVRKL